MAKKAIPIRLPRGRKSVWALLIVLLLVGLRVWQESLTPSVPEALQEGTYRVERVVDGDTLKLANGAKVRLIGVDTPEVYNVKTPEPFGPEASAYAEQFINDAGRDVRLQLDLERKDKYGRFLAYVYAGDRMLNEELARAGLATYESQYNYRKSMKDRFRKAEEAAKAERIGIWSQEE